jgi:hypothetical protein
MLHRLQHKMKRFIQKQGIKLHKISDPTRLVKGQHERECVNICKKLIPLKETKLLITPISPKKYIRNDELDIYVIIEGRHVNIINHVYSYSLVIEGKGMEVIMNMFNNELESRREKFETEITSNIKHSLKTISNNIK